MVLNTPVHATSRPGQVNPTMVVCTEPSPDTAKIVAAAVGASFDAPTKTDVSLSVATKESLLQLAERTVTIQLLRDQMFRACEAYGNGAITAAEYSLLMSRNNDAMVTLMLAESATRLAPPNLASLSSPDTITLNVPLPGGNDNTPNSPEDEEELNDQSLDDSDDAAEDPVASTEAPDPAPPDGTEVVDGDGANSGADGSKESNDQAVPTLTLELKSQDGTTNEKVSSSQAQNTQVAKVLARMQQQYLDTDAQEHVISACLVEMGRVRRPFQQRSDELAFVEASASVRRGDPLLAAYGAAVLGVAARYDLPPPVARALAHASDEEILTLWNAHRAETVEQGGQATTRTMFEEDAMMLRDLVAAMGRAGTTHHDLARDYFARTYAGIERPIETGEAVYINDPTRMMIAIDAADRLSLLGKFCYEEMRTELQRAHDVSLIRVAERLVDLEGDAYETANGSSSWKDATAIQATLTAILAYRDCPEGREGDDCRFGHFLTAVRKDDDPR